MGKAMKLFIIICSFIGLIYSCKKDKKNIDFITTLNSRCFELYLSPISNDTNRIILFRNNSNNIIKRSGGTMPIPYSTNTYNTCFELNIFDNRIYDSLVYLQNSIKIIKIIPNSVITTLAHNESTLYLDANNRVIKRINITIEL